MHFVGVEGSILPCYVDEGRKLFVVKNREMLKFHDTVDALVDGDEEFSVHGCELIEQTRRVVFLDVDCDYFLEDEESEADSPSESEDYSEYDSYSESEGSEETEESDDEYWEMMSSNAQ